MALKTEPDMDTPNLKVIFMLIFLIYFKLYPAHSRVGRGKPNVKTLHSPISAEFWKYCVLSGGTQHHACM